jgi:hypothetical protein
LRSASSIFINSYTRPELPHPKVIRRFCRTLVKSHE